MGSGAGSGSGGGWLGEPSTLSGSEGTTSAGGATLLVSSHVMDEAARCEALLLMRDGEILAQTTPRDLLARTGADGMENAFLRLIESRAAASAVHRP